MSESLQPLLPFAASLAAGLLIGIALDRSRPGQGHIRSAALMALLGAVCGFLGESGSSGAPVVAGFLVVGALLALGQGAARLTALEPGAGHRVVLLIAYAIGAGTWGGHADAAMLAAVFVAALLHVSEGARRWFVASTRGEMLGVLQFALFAMVGLPLLPDVGYGSHEVLDPLDIGLVTVLVGAAGLAAHRAWPRVRSRGGWVAATWVGGLAGALGMTLAHARAVRAQVRGIEAVGSPESTHRARHEPVLAIAENLAQSAGSLRLLVIALLLAPDWAGLLLFFLGAQALAQGLLAAWQVRALRRVARGPDVQPGQAAAPASAVVPPLGYPERPPDPATASRLFFFAAGYTVLLQLGALLVDPIGSVGMALFGGLAALVSPEQSVLVIMRLSAMEEGDPTQAIAGLASALALALLVRVCIALRLGGRHYARCLMPHWLASATALALAVALSLEWVTVGSTG